jgi:uncharacterized protein YutE (UPF0331/DUF86 family)
MKSLEKKLKDIDDRVSRLRELSSDIASFEDYQASRDYREMVERNLQVAIEGCLDVGKIIISREKLRQPEDNKGIFVVLAEVGILRKESLSSLVPMAGTRNILVHGYDKIEDVQVYGILKRKLGDFLNFLKDIKDNYLQKKGRNQLS